MELGKVMNEIEGSVQTLSENKAWSNTAPPRMCKTRQRMAKMPPVRLVSCAGLWENRGWTEGIVERKLVPGLKSQKLDTHLVEISHREVRIAPGTTRVNRSGMLLKFVVGCGRGIRGY